MAKTYAEKLKDQRWLIKRAEILSRDECKCRYCQGTEDLQVHHTRYFKNRAPWDYEDIFLITLCRECHMEFEEQLDQIKTILALLQNDDRSLDQIRVILLRQLSPVNTYQYRLIRSDRSKQLELN